MTKSEFQAIERHMLNAMTDSAHDPMHIYRVLYLALDIAASEENVNMDVLVAACLLHDIGREQQSKDLELDHAQIGGPMAYAYLASIGWTEEAAGHVQRCVETHRFRKGEPPESIEAKIVFDADKLDVTGAIGMARTLIYGGQVLEPLYLLDEHGQIEKAGGGAEVSSFFQEINYKFFKIYDSFFTERARQIGAQRRPAFIHFYESLEREIQLAHDEGARRLLQMLD